MRLGYYARQLVRTRPSYVFGRFYLFRRAFARCVRARQRLAGGRVPALSGLPASLVVTTEPRLAVSELARDAVSGGLRLEDHLVAEIRSFAESAELSSGAGSELRFRYGDVREGRLPDGQFVALGFARDPDQCAAVRAIRDDPVLQAVVANYLGYVPRSADIWLYWSFVGQADDEDRRAQYQTIDFHFDVHDFNFCYVHLYLTDTDAASGAHVMVRGSHRHKPLGWLLGSARQNDEAVLARYGKENILTLAGKAGEGFIEDTSCYHKALAPRSRERLMLQLRYH